LFLFETLGTYPPLSNLTAMPKPANQSSKLTNTPANVKTEEEGDLNWPYISPKSDLTLATMEPDQILVLDVKSDLSNLYSIIYLN
jgi:hypothetical protein